MALKRHPPKIIFRGDWKRGQPLVRRGKQEMGRTVDQSDRLQAPHYFRTSVIDPDLGIVIHTVTTGPFQYIEIVVPFLPGEGPEEVPSLLEEKLEEEISEFVGIYSGFSWGYSVETDFVDGPPPLGSEQNINRLHDFNPTEACREAYPDDFLATTYQPITRLNQTSDSEVQNRVFSDWTEGYRDEDEILPELIAESNLIHPCNYSGPIARATSLALGNGTFNLFTSAEREELLDNTLDPGWVAWVKFFGFRINYDFHNDRLHNAIQDNLGSWWIIEVSDSHGIVARRLPMIKFTYAPENLIEASAVNEFKGIPSGEAFPDSASAINTMVTNGDAIRLKTKADWDTEFASTNELFWTDHLNWVFNDTGKEGRCCTYNTTDEPNGFWTSQYWQLIFEITTDGTGNSTGTAILTQLDSQIIANSRKLLLNGIDNSTDHAAGFPLVFFNPDANNWFTVNPATPSHPAHVNNVPDIMDVVVWVGWIDNQWHEINYYAPKYTEWEGTLTVDKLDTSEVAHIGDIPLLTRAYTDSWLKSVSSYSTLVPRQEEADTTFADWFKYTMVANEVLASDFFAADKISTIVSNIWWIKEVRKMHWRQEDRRSDRNDAFTHFVLTPYNRNAYYAWEERRILKKLDALDEESSFISLGDSITQIKYLDDAGCSRPVPQPESIPTTYAPPSGWTAFGTPSGAPNVVTNFGSNDWKSDLNGSSCSSPPTANCQYIADSVGGTYSFSGGGSPLSTLPWIGGTWDDDDAVVPDLCGGGSIFESVECTEISSGSLASINLVPPGIGTAQLNPSVVTLTDTRTINIKIVADRLTPDSPLIDLGVFKNAETYDNVSIFTPKAHLQTAVIGNEAAIFADVTDVEENIPQGKPFFFPIMDQRGIHPELPDTAVSGYRDHLWRWITFIGVNTL